LLGQRRDEIDGLIVAANLPTFRFQPCQESDERRVRENDAERLQPVGCQDDQYDQSYDYCLRAPYPLVRPSIVCQSGIDALLCAIGSRY